MFCDRLKELVCNSCGFMSVWSDHVTCKNLFVKTHQRLRVVWCFEFSPCNVPNVCFGSLPPSLRSLRVKPSNFETQRLNRCGNLRGTVLSFCFGSFCLEVVFQKGVCFERKTFHLSEVKTETLLRFLAFLNEEMSDRSQNRCT